MTKKWDEMNLTEKSLAYAQMRDRFPDRGASSASELKITKLCELGIPADDDVIGAVIRGETSVDKIKLATVTVKPTSTESKPKAIFGERSIPEAMKLSAEYNQTVSEDEQRSWHYFVSC